MGDNTLRIKSNKSLHTGAILTKKKIQCPLLKVCPIFRAKRSAKYSDPTRQMIN